MFAKHSPLHGLHNGPHSGEEFGSQLQTLSYPHHAFKVYTVVVTITAPSKGCQLNPKGWRIDTFRNHV